MIQPLTPKVAMLSALHFILVVLLALFFNWAFMWLINHTVYPLMNWFNGLTFFWKWVLLFAQGFVVVLIVLSILKMITGLITHLIFYKLPENSFTIIMSTLVYLTTVTFCIIELWKTSPKFSFFIFLEFLFMVFIIFSINSVLLPWYQKEKLRKHEEQEAMKRFGINI